MGNQSNYVISDLTQELFNLDRIKLGSTVIINNQDLQTREIKYLANNNSRAVPLIIQTPKLYLPFGLSKEYQQTNRYYLHMALKNLEFDPRIKIFIKHLNKVDQYFQEHYPSFNLNTSIRESEDPFYPPFLRCKVPRFNMQVYDDRNQISKSDNIFPGCYAISLIHLKNLWIKPTQKTLGLTYYVLQIKIYSPIPILDCYLIDDKAYQDETLCQICYQKIVRTPCVEGVIEDESLLSHNVKKCVVPQLPTEYEKYQKMLRLGIPILAVIQRCQMDEVDPEPLLNHQKKSGGMVSSSNINHNSGGLSHSEGCSMNQSNSIPPPPPKLPSSSNSRSLRNNCLTTPQRIVISTDDLLKVRQKLSRPDPNYRPGKPRLNLKKRDPRVPSLGAILRQINNLRPTK